jgi:hypothetical protein
MDWYETTRSGVSVTVSMYSSPEVAYKYSKNNAQGKLTSEICRAINYILRLMVTLGPLIRG